MLVAAWAFELMPVFQPLLRMPEYAAKALPPTLLLPLLKSAPSARLRIVVGALVAVRSCTATTDELSLLLLELLVELSELSVLNEANAKARLPESATLLSELSLPESATFVLLSELLLATFCRLRSVDVLVEVAVLPTPTPPVVGPAFVPEVCCAAAGIAKPIAKTKADTAIVDLIFMGRLLSCVNNPVVAPV